jgi:hypothetical protein
MLAIVLVSSACVPKTNDYVFAVRVNPVVVKTLDFSVIPWFVGQDWFILDDPYTPPTTLPSTPLAGGDYRMCIIVFRCQESDLSTLFSTLDLYAKNNYTPLGVVDTNLWDVYAKKHGIEKLFPTLR